MRIHLDTSALVAAVVEARRELDRLESWIREYHQVTFCSLVLYEWLRGPRVERELRLAEALFAGQTVVAFQAEEARVAAGLYRVVARPRSREVDIAIAACALVHDASLWTLNPQDYSDIPGLRLVSRDRA